MFTKEVNLSVPNLPNIPFVAVLKLLLYVSLPVVIATGDDYYALAQKYLLEDGTMTPSGYQLIPEYELIYLKFKTVAAALAGLAASLTRSIKDEYKVLNIKH